MEQPLPDNVARIASRRKIGELSDDMKTVTAPAGRPGVRGKARKKGHRVALVDLDVLSKVEMTAAELGVFTTIARFIPEKGGIEARVSVQEIADRLGMKQPNVSRVIAALVRRDLIFRIRQGVWEVNPHILYNGSFEDWNPILDSYIQPKVKR